MRKLELRHPYMGLFLALLWMLLQNAFTLADFVFGLVAAAVVLQVLPPPAMRWERPRLLRLPQLFSLLLYFLKEVVVSNLFVARIVLQRRPGLYPGIIAMPLKVQGNTRITAVANMITLTPGTLTLDVSPENDTLYIHCIDARDPEAVLASAREFERRVEEVTL